MHPFRSRILMTSAPVANTSPRTVHTVPPSLVATPLSPTLVQILSCSSSWIPPSSLLPPMFSSQTPSQPASQPAREHYKMRPAEPQFSWNPTYILHLSVGLFTPRVVHCLWFRAILHTRILLMPFLFNSERNREKQRDSERLRESDTLRPIARTTVL